MTNGSTRSIVVRGWRFLGHSYAHVNQQQCLELLRRPGISLSHVDSPYWNTQWKPIPGLLDSDQESKLAAIVTPPDDFQADAMLRIEYPYDLSPSAARKTFTFITVENTLVPTAYIDVERPIAELMAKSPVTILTPSKWSRDGLMRSGVKSKQIELLPHGVDTSIFRPLRADERAKLRERFGWQDAFVLLNVGAMTHNKGIDLLLKSFAAIAAEHPQAMLALKGFNSMFESEAAFQRAAALAGPGFAKAASRVQYLGDPIPQREMVQLFQAADAYVCPYRGEGFNLPALEAAACGLPVICTSGGPTDDFTTSDFALKISSTLIPAPQGGQEFKPNVDNLTAHIRKVIKDTGFRAAAAQAGPAHVQQNFTWPKAVDRLLSLI